MSFMPSLKPNNNQNLGLDTPAKPNIRIMTPKYDNPQDALNKVIVTDSACNVIIQKPDGKKQTLYEGALQNPNTTYKDKFGNLKIGV